MRLDGRGGWLVWSVVLAACSGVEQAPDASTTGDGSLTVVDSDVDWLCNDTERALGSDPDNPDTDGDGMPDGVEVRYGFDWNDAAQPALSQVTRLRAAPGGSVDQQVFVVVDGTGEAFSGEMAANTTLEPDWATAEAYFQQAAAISAEPPDNVFGFPDNGDRIGAVLGRTRIGFRLRFVFPDNSPRTCKQVVAYNYALKRDDGQRFGQQRLLLVIAPDDTTAPWCPRTACL